MVASVRQAIPGAKQSKSACACGRSRANKKKSYGRIKKRNISILGEKRQG